LPFEVFDDFDDFDDFDFADLTSFDFFVFEDDFTIVFLCFFVVIIYIREHLCRVLSTKINDSRDACLFQRLFL